MRRPLTEAYGVCSSKCEAVICVTLLHGMISVGVIFAQLFPPSRVIQNKPSSVPAHSVFRSLKDGAGAKITPRFVSALVSSAAMLPRLAGMPDFSRERSGLMVCQDSPPSEVLNKTFVV